MSEATPAVTRILLVDDHSLFREAIGRLLGAEPDFDVIGQCATVDEAVNAVRQTPVDMVLLDINLGLQQGGAFLNLARAAGYRGRVLVVTAGVSQIEAARLLERGCSGIILKQQEPQLLIDRIRAVMAAPKHAPAQPPDVPEDHNPPGMEATRAFTPRERQVLRGAFSGQTNKEIAFQLGVSEPLVKAVMQQLFSKIGVRSRSQLVRAAIERHWKELDEEPGFDSKKRSVEDDEAG